MLNGRKKQCGLGRGLKCAVLQAAINALGREPGGGLVVMPNAFMTVHRASIISATARNNIPAVYTQFAFVRDGGLLYYGVDQVASRCLLCRSHPARRKAGQVMNAALHRIFPLCDR
jgi:hypothetical protein